MQRISKIVKKKVSFGFLVMSVMAMNVCFAFASGGGADTSAMTTALTGVKTDALAVLGAVAPIGIGIAGAFMVWKFGMKFFKSLAK